MRAAVPPLLHTRMHSWPVMGQLQTTLLTPRILQSEHKVFPRLQTFITRKQRGIQTYFF